MPRLKVRRRHENTFVHSSRAQDRRINHLRAVRRTNHENLVCARVVKLKEELVDFFLFDVCVRSQLFTFWYQALDFVYKDDGRAFLPSHIKDFGDVAHGTVNVGRTHGGWIHLKQVIPKFFRKLPDDKGLAAPRRSIEKESVRDRQLELLVFLRVEERVDDIADEKILQSPHAGDAVPPRHCGRSSVILANCSRLWVGTMMAG